MSWITFVVSLLLNDIDEGSLLELFAREHSLEKKELDISACSLTLFRMGFFVAVQAEKAHHS